MSLDKLNHLRLTIHITLEVNTSTCFLSSSGLRKESSHCSVLLLLFVLDRPVYDVGSFLLPACMLGRGRLVPSCFDVQLFEREPLVHSECFGESDAGLSRKGQYIESPL